MLPAGPGSTMGFLVERTIFKVDVLYITVRVDEDTANGLERLVDGNSAYGRGLEDSVAALVRAAPEAVAEIRFVRDVSLEQFLEGVDEDMASARDAGWITPETFDEITSGLRDWFSFLEAEGIASGDRLTYHVRGDTLRTTYRRDGAASPVLDQTDIGDQNVQALWGGYFAPGSSFRESLVRSLWEGG
ncbi:MAG: hypothetical protein R3195_05885 [Gemmatimonadota bacterium]|nr:hypothetical protein [Gemmatimonadota bacterium]